MIIPIRCFTCNQIIANKWNKYQEKIQEQYLKEDVTNNIKKRFIDVSNLDKNIEGKILDELKIHKYCCRRMLMSHVDMAEII
jgi:DNA-directed RNA polymerase subunit N (RpoN/RPB10)|tara:strand:+ start:1940 stop:2185 length:246 start_codon:yes stop_codon:yes gene_type:complete